MTKEKTRQLFKNFLFFTQISAGSRQDKKQFESIQHWQSLSLLWLHIWEGASQFVHAGGPQRKGPLSCKINPQVRGHPKTINTGENALFTTASLCSGLATGRVRGVRTGKASIQGRSQDSATRLGSCLHFRRGGMPSFFSRQLLFGCLFLRLKNFHMTFSDRSF